MLVLLYISYLYLVIVNAVGPSNQQYQFRKKNNKSRNKKIGVTESEKIEILLKLVPC